jgi:hypothetical protein
VKGNEMSSVMVYSKSNHPLRLSSAALFLSFLFFFSAAYAQVAHTGTNESPSLWAFGISITYPLGGQIYMVQLSYSVWEKGDILWGVAYQDWKNDRGHSHAYTLLLGYRQFIWEGIHAEIEFWPAYNPFESSVDGKTYKGFELWTSLRVGYRFDFDIAANPFFILVQPSVGFGVARQNPWPGKEFDEGPVFEPQFIAGMRF